MNRASKERVVLGMSGGVDSSVSAFLLQQQGYEVIGITMKVWPQDCLSRAEDKCCGPQAVADARSIAHSLGIPHYVVDEAEEFEKLVINYFGQEYREGRTPNPCVMCNEKLKFGRLQDKARALGAHYVATGHYARIEHGSETSLLRRAVDERKDQSYFLFSLRPEQLRRSLTPLGALTKPEVRSIAQKLGMKVYDKEDSQEICFVPGNDYAGFLQSHFGSETFQPGGIYDRSGKFLGEHQGIERYTVGQRKGLPGGSLHPLYVIDIDPIGKRVIVGEYGDLRRPECFLANTNWLPGQVHDGQEITVKIRYNWPAAPARLELLPHGRARVIFHEPQQSISPGQAAVCYDGDLVLGGGWIERSEVPIPQALPIEA